MKRFKRFVLGAIAACAVVALLPSVAAAKDMQDIAKAGVLRVGVVPYPPDVIKDPQSGEYKGVFVDAIKHVCERVKVECAFQEFSWGTFVAGLQARQVDLSIATSYATIPRAMVVNFSRPIYYLGYKAVSRKENAARFNSVEDLNDPSVSVAVCQGCGQHDWVQRFAPKANLRVVKTEEAAMLEVVSGKADVGVGASAAVNYALASQSSLQPVLGGRIYSKNQVAWAVNKEDVDILLFINVAIGQLISTGKLGELAEQYEAPWLADVAF